MARQISAVGGQSFDAGRRLDVVFCSITPPRWTRWLRQHVPRIRSWCVDA